MKESQFWFHIDKEVSVISNAPTHTDSNRKKNGIEQTEESTFYRTSRMVWLVKILSHTEFITSCREINSSSFCFTWHFIETFYPPSFLQIIGFEYKKSLAWHIVAQQSHTNLSLYSVHNVNNLVSQFDLFFHVFVACWYQYWKQVLLFTEVFRCLAQLFPQSLELVENCYSHCKVVYQSDIFVVTFLE